MRFSLPIGRQLRGFSLAMALSVLTLTAPARADIDFQKSVWPILPHDDSEIMPSKGDPLTKPQTEVLRQWIEQGAEFGAWTGAAGGSTLEADPPTVAAPVKRAWI